MSVRNYTGMSNLDAALLVTKYSKKLRRRAILKDIYSPMVGAVSEDILYKQQNISIPNSIYTKISAEDQKGANNIRVGLKVTTNGNILRGNTVAMGREVPPQVKDGTLYRNNYRFVVQDTPGYGENRLDAEWYSLYEEHVKELAPHAAAEEGLEIRQAYLETYGWNLWTGSTTATCQPHWSRHFYICGIPSIYNQPAYHPTLATYTNRIVAGIQTASGSANLPQTAAQMLNGGELDKIARFAKLRRLFPLYIDGRQSFILTISELQGTRFSNPDFQDTLGARWTAQNRIESETQYWNGLLGYWDSTAGVRIYLVVDERLPTLIPSGTAAPWGLRAGYVWPQEDDLRERDNALARDACILHGSGGVANLEPEKMHFITQDWDYAVRLGKGYAGVRGIQQLQFDSTPQDVTGAGREYYGSAIVVCGRDETGSI